MASNDTPDATRLHIDAETLAAWADRGLPAEAAAEVELHLSNCDRCQEVLAAFVRSEPHAGAAILPFWSRRPIQWSAAGLAAAAAIVAMIWIGRPPAVQTESTVALQDAAAPVPTPPLPSPAAIDQLTSPKAVSGVAEAPAEQRRDRQEAGAAAVGQQSLRKEAKKATESLVAGGTLAAPPPVAQSIPAVAPPVAPPPTALPTPSPAAAASVTVGAASPVVASPALTRPATMAESVSDAALPVIEISAPEPGELALRSTAGGAGRGGGGGRAAAVGRDFSATRAQIRWRILGGTRVERTQDAGTTWTAVTLEPELKTPLVAGSATSPTNCWLVGREGVVLVTLDGRTFRRVSLPQAVHLTAITAQDGQRAAVTAIDGRKFSTVDGGQTWK